MTKEKGIFTVAENEELKSEAIYSDHQEYSDKPAPMVLEVSENEAEGCEEECTDWRKTKDPKHFLGFLNKEVDRIPFPMQVVRNRTELEGAHNKWKKLDALISQALRDDYDGVLDLKFIDKTRGHIERHIDQMEDMLDGLNQLKKNKKGLKKRRADDSDEQLKKEANTPGFKGMYVQISPFERAVCGAMVNGKVSGGRNIEELYEVAKKKYKFSDREELSILQILADWGYPTFKDRLRLDEDEDPSRDTKEDGFGEWSSSYQA